MAALTPSKSTDEIARLAMEIQRSIEPNLTADDDGKYIAIDIHSSQYELDQNDYAAVMRLRSRCPNGELWLGRVGQPAAYRMGHWR